MQVNSFSELSKAHADDPNALPLKAMNVLVEGLKEKDVLAIIPSGASNAMNLAV
jgi:hypothetical protein